MELLVLEIAAMKFGLDASHIREVQRAVALTPLPESAGAVEGALNLRGELVPVVDLRRLIGAAAKPMALHDHLVVFRTAAQSAAIRVDRALELVSPSESAEQRAAASSSIIRQIARVRDDFVYVLDPERLLTAGQAASAREVVAS